jgi:hypothetical protein
MKVFVWQSVGQCTNRWKSDGGVVVFAESDQRARQLANDQPGCTIDPKELPDDVRDVIGGEERVYIMPDAGCD